MSAHTASVTAFDWQQGWRYGLMGLPLAFVALPLYVLLPNHYAREFGMPLATLGAVLLGARLFDAFIDPLLGRWSDRLFGRSPFSVLRWGAVAALALGIGFALLFFPLVSASSDLMVWLVIALAWTYAAYSALSVLHQSWGARLGGDEVQRSRVVAWREGLGLLGVILASVSPLAFGLPASVALFFYSASCGLVGLESCHVAAARAADPTRFRWRAGCPGFGHCGYSACQSDFAICPPRLSCIAGGVHGQRYCQRRTCNLAAVFCAGPAPSRTELGAVVSG
jgi:hypothetical protein